LAGRKRALAGLLVAAVLLAACSSTGADRVELDRSGNRIVVHVDDIVGPFDRRLLGTNVPAWLSREQVAGQEFGDLLVASGTTLLRLPGGSWSNGYDWLGCELGDPQRCEWTWAMRPSDFVGLLAATGLPASWTVSINGSAEEAAAAVAFFNGDVDDDRPIGTDRNGRDWRTVGDWARLRAERGYPESVGIRYWDVGNEVYGAVQDTGPNCAEFGWEQVWTCDGAEYVEGNGDHDGFLRFREAMRAVDADIEVGAVGVGDRGGWGDWDAEVMEAAGADIDFYIVHNYGSTGDVPPEDVLEIPRRDWPRITDDVRVGFADAGIADVPIAVTEHNLVAFFDGDDERLMTTALNAFYLAETIGQMATNGVTIANQWNVANGRADNGTDYGLVDAETLVRSPAYYAMALWSRFGDELVRVDVGGGVDELMVYGGRTADGSVRLLVVNPTGAPLGATISAEPTVAADAVTADVVAADALLSTSVTFNGASTPRVDLADPGEVVPLTPSGELSRDFPPYSITLLSWNAQS
jgi:hypothetical protein